MQRQLVTTDRLKPGQVLAEPALKTGTIIFPKGTAIDEKVVSQLVTWNITEVMVFVKESEAGAEPEAPAAFAGPPVAAAAPVAALPDDPRTLITAAEREKSAAAKPAAISETPDGLLVQGSIGLGHGDLETKLPVRIEGSVLGGVTIHSPDAVIVTGDLIGAQIRAGGAVTARMVRHAVVFAGSATFENVVDSIIDVKGRLDVTAGNGTIVGSRLTAGGAIVGKRIGSIERKPTVLTVTNQMSKSAYKQLLDLEAAIRTLQMELGQLKKVIDLIQMLGQKVAALPPEKKAQLKQQSDLFFTKQKKLAEALQQKQALEQDLAELSDDDFCPIRALEIAYAGITIVIDGTEYPLEKITNNVGFHKKKLITLRLFR